MGFSRSTSTPRSRAATPTSACRSFGSTMSTASTSEPGEELAVVEMDGDVGEVAPRRLGGGLGATGDRGEPGARRLRDGLGMVTAPGPIADQSESNHTAIS